MRATALVDDIIAPVQSSLWLLFAAVGLVLAAACANVASLLLARMLRRAREVVTRAALGASGLRLVRQFLAESLLLSLAGGVVGAVIASWGTDALLGFYRGRLPRLHEVSLDWQAFVFLLLACTVAAASLGWRRPWRQRGPIRTTRPKRRVDTRPWAAGQAGARRARDRRSHARVRPGRRRGARAARDRSAAQCRPA